MSHKYQSWLPQQSIAQQNKTSHDICEWTNYLQVINRILNFIVLKVKKATFFFVVLTLSSDEITTRVMLRLIAGHQQHRSLWRVSVSCSCTCVVKHLFWFIGVALGIFKLSVRQRSQRRPDERKSKFNCSQSKTGGTIKKKVPARSLTIIQRSSTDQ